MLHQVYSVINTMKLHLLNMDPNLHQKTISLRANLSYSDYKILQKLLTRTNKITIYLLTPRGAQESFLNYLKLKSNRNPMVNKAYNEKYGQKMIFISQIVKNCVQIT